MSLLEALRLAFNGLNSNRLRSGLTMLGIMIGVGAVILLVAVGNGATVQVQKQIGLLGSNIIYVYPSNTKSGGVSQGFGSGASLTQADVDALKDPTQAPDLVTAIPITGAPGNLVYGSQNWFAQVQGSTEDFASVRSSDLASGSFFTADQVNSNATVAVIGQTVAEELFAGQSAVGQNMKVNGANFEVVGVLASKGSNGATNQDDVVMAPISTVEDSLTGYGSISSITVEAKSEASLNAAEGEVTQILEERHKIKNTEEPGFEVLNQGSLLSTSSSTSGVFTTLLGEVAAISLLVAVSVSCVEWVTAPLIRGAA